MTTTDDVIVRGWVLDRSSMYISPSIKRADWCYFADKCTAPRRKVEIGESAYVLEAYREDTHKRAPFVAHIDCMTRFRSDENSR